LVEIEIDFEVKKIIYRNVKTGYTIANIKLINHPRDIDIPTAEPIIAGYFNAIHNKDEFKAVGSWVDTGSNGYRFNVNTSTLIFPETEKSIAAFITRFAKGIGAKSANKIVKTFKENTFNVILNEPDKLFNVEGLSSKKVKVIHESISDCKDFENTVLFLSPLGLKHLEILKVYEELGASAIHLVSENPYILYKYTKIPFKTIDLLAQKLKFKANNPERIKSGILFYIDKQIKNKGDMFVYEKDIFDNLQEFLYKYGQFKKSYLNSDEIKFALNSLIIDKYLVEDKTDSGEKVIYRTFYKIIENKIIKKLENLIKIKPNEIFSNGNIISAIRKYEDKEKMILAEKQKEAVFMALNNRISILNGGPGTGKTQTINAIIDCLKILKPNGTIELAAPTGRAAKRMTELTHTEAKTIHRLIGLAGFTEDEVNLKKIDADFLVVDEASMIDAYVFNNLLSAIQKNTKVLIVGDYQQLPSVGAGLILRDLVDSKTIETTTLSEIFRQEKGSQIIDNAYKIINGNKNLNLDKSKEDFYFIKEISVKKISNLIMLSIKKLLKIGYKINDIQVLSVMNKGDLGVEELNRKIQKIFNPHNPQKQEIELNQKILRVNDKVMQTENDYDLGVFNGEVGNIVSINRLKHEVKVNFGDNKEILYNNENFCELTLAYATTVHKSQGCEFDVIIMPFHRSLNILLNRNIIYTGITRAKKRVVCIGDMDELMDGIDRTENVIRNSRIKEKLEKIVLQSSYSVM